MAINLKEIIANGLLEICEWKPLDKITVKQVLEKTGVSRQSFYNHFIDMDDLIHYIYDSKVVPKYNSKNLDMNFYKNLVESFDNMRKYKKFMIQACKMEGQNCLKDYIFTHCEEFDLQFHQKLYGSQPMPESLKLATIYHAHASSSMSLSWILSGMGVSSEEMARLICQMRGVGMEALFKDGAHPGNPYEIRE
ncbi:MAG: TetR/AcrR family transcriptional regulator C-terminal domain-containing protein [Firmicutes bacterium]|nr:TetR/AcrR family transcriptional regulator C-terminal domain-containing protein [Bacillota bacterium]